MAIIKYSKGKKIMRRISLTLLCFTILFSICGCGKESFKGKTFVNEDLDIYYTDNQGNILEWDKDTYDYFEIEKQKKEGYIKTNYYKLEYIYSFISDSVVKYEYKKDGSTIKSYNCEYSFEEDNIIKLNCDNNIELLKYNKEKNCITDESKREYCI